MLHGLEEVCVEITNRCLCKCIHCSSSADARPNQSQLTLDQVKSIVDQAAFLSISALPLSPKSINLDELIHFMPFLSNGKLSAEQIDAEIINNRRRKRGKPVLELSGGEPLLHPDIPEIIRYGKKKGFRITVYTAAICDSGKRITPSDAEALAAILDEDDRIAISLEGATADTHEQMTNVKGHFDMVLGAIDCFRKYDNLVLSAHCTPTRINYKDIPELIELLAEKRIREVAFLRLVPQGRALKNMGKLMLTRAEFMELQEIITDVWKKGELSTGEPLGANTVKVRWGCPIDFRHLLYPAEKRPCHGGRDTLVVRPDGSIHPCPAWKQIDYMSLGNIATHPIRDVWRDSEVLNDFRSLATGDLQGDCYWCTSKAICGGGCPAQRILANRKRGLANKKALLSVGPDPLCFRNLVGSGESLQEDD